MKKLNLRVALWATTISLSVMAVSCVKQPDPTPSTPQIDPKEVFDFSVTKSYSLNVGFDVVEGYRVGFDVYTENPFTVAEDGSVVKNNAIKPIDKGFANDKGEYIHPIVVPTYAKQLYIYTKDAGVNPRFFVAQIENGVLGKAVPASYTGQTAAATKAGGTIITLDENLVVGAEAVKLKKKHLLLSNWYQGSTADGGSSRFIKLLDGVIVQLLGRPLTLSYASYKKFGPTSAPNDAMPISAEIWAKINSALPGDEGAAVDPKFLDDGDIHITKSETELDLIFMDQRAAFKNTLAYYCYPTNNAPKSPTDIKHPVIAFANGMAQKNRSETDLDLMTSLYPGEGVKLKYVDENGQMHDKFPAGTSVGWILYRNGYGKLGMTSNGLLRYTVTEGDGTNYANFDMHNKIGKPNTAVLRVGDFVVLGFDDGTPNQTAIRDYLDLIFHVKASVKDAITDPIPPVDPDPKPTVDIIEKSGTLAFEDLWPSQGDFDMNDVVVTYHSKITINKNNEVLETEDKFTLQWCGANYKNGFSYTVDGVSPANATVTFEGTNIANAKVDQTFSDLTIHLFDGISRATANGIDKQSITVKTKFNTPISKDAFKHAPYNAYIRITDDKGSKNKETHLTNMKPVNSAVADWFGKSDDKSDPTQNLYFITFLKKDNNQQLPFAIHVPSTGNPDLDQPFVIAKEGTRIDTYYPKFLNWINTKGEQDADWYLHPMK